MPYSIHIFIIIFMKIQTIIFNKFSTHLRDLYQVTLINNIDCNSLKRNGK